MPRNPNTTLEKIAHWLSSSDKPRTIAEIDSAGIATKATCYRLLIDREARDKGIVEVPISAKLHGIYAVGGHYPCHYTYSDPADSDYVDATIKQQQKKLTAAARKLESTGEVLDSLESKVLSTFRQQRKDDPRDDNYKDNFSKPITSESFLMQVDIPEVREVLLSDITKFRTFLISAFVASFNEDSGE